MTDEAKKPELTAYEKLPARMRRFVDLIVAGRTGVDAAREIGIGGKDPRFRACKLRARPDVKAAIAEREAEAMAEAGISRTRTWTEVRRIALFDHRKLFDPEGNLVPVKDLDDDTAAGIAAIEIEDLYVGQGRERTRVGDLKSFKAWNKNDALKMILQGFGELVDRHQLAGPNGEPLQTGPVAPVINLTLTGDVPAESASASEADAGAPK